MEIKLHRDLKPLIANFNRIGIGYYLKTSEYDNLILENDLDGLWKSSVKQIRNQNNVTWLGFEDDGADEEEAIQFVLQLLFESEKDLFEKFLIITLNGYLDWNGKKKDLTKVIESLKHLNFPNDKVKDLNLKNKNVMSLNKPARKEVKLVDETADSHPIMLINSKIEVDKQQCFVIMPFNEKLTPIYETILKPVLNELKFRAIRADEIFTSKPIIGDIWNSIKKSGVIIADLTDQNPNVFYELGLAHALNKNVILMSQDLEDVPFDLKHNRIVIYKDSISGAEKLKLDLKKFLENHIMM